MGLFDTCSEAASLVKRAVQVPPAGILWAKPRTSTASKCFAGCAFYGTTKPDSGICEIQDVEDLSTELASKSRILLHIARNSCASICHLLLVAQHDLAR